MKQEVRTLLFEKIQRQGYKAVECKASDNARRRRRGHFLISNINEGT